MARLIVRRRLSCSSGSPFPRKGWLFETASCRCCFFAVMNMCWCGWKLSLLSVLDCSGGVLMEIFLMDGRDGSCCWQAEGLPLWCSSRSVLKHACQLPSIGSAPCCLRWVCSTGLSSLISIAWRFVYIYFHIATWGCLYQLPSRWATSLSLQLLKTKAWPK